MPYYDYACSHCDTNFELNLSMNRREEPLLQPCPDCGTNGTITQIIGATAIGDPIRLGVKRPDGGWNDVLSKVKEAHPRGNWDNKKYGK
jgi:putative FmdB family regulatory protein